MTAFCILACMVKYRIGLLYAVYLVINEDTGCIVIARVCAPVAISCDVTLSLRGCLHPWQSHTWNKYSCYTFLMAEIATLALLARNDKGIPQGIAALVSLARNDNARPSLRGCLRPWQSHTWNKKSCYTFLMAEIATLALLARNDKGIPQGIAALVSLARNDNARPSLRGCLRPWQSHTWNKKSCYTFLMAEIAALALLARNDNARPSLRGCLHPWQSLAWSK